VTKLHALMLDLKSYYPSPALQLGLLVSYACVEEEVRDNVRFTFSEHPREQSAEEIARLILDSDADLVGASNYAWNYKKICRILELLEGSGRDLPRIVLGGPNSSGEFGAAMMRRHPAISAMVDGEGEPAFRDILSNLVDSPARAPFDGARNCVLRGEGDEVVRPNVGHRIKSLDEVPSPYLSGLLPVRPSPVFYETNRGCPYSCAFCYWARDGNSKLYRMSLERIREEMEFFAKSKVSSFWITDANFGIFKSDAEIAELMRELNERYGYPFRHVGVNWAKNSSDRVLDIATTLKQGRMACTTTLAVQTVTAEAEDKARRHPMPPSRFASLISEAEDRDLDTYTDIIWGLPGESLGEYLDGLDAVICTGVPAILIHQLYLLPGTEFYDRREELGLTMRSELEAERIAGEERSDYAEYIVVSHPKMDREAMIGGNRILGINHLLHNHDLGRSVGFFLARYGVSHRRVYEHLDAILVGDAELAGEGGGGDAFLEDVRAQILKFAENVGLDEFAFYRRLSQAVWFHPNSDGLGYESRFEDVCDFAHRFYVSLADRLGIAVSADERRLLAALVEFNLLISPKPAWSPPRRVEFEWDVLGIWTDMQRVVLETGKPQEEDLEAWGELGARVRARVGGLLTEDYLASRREPTAYAVENPWRIPPQQRTADWLITARSKHSVLVPVQMEATQEAHALL
jgi:radical SAM superfamily enzyme YgiQ (UPF0313 family)